MNHPVKWQLITIVLFFLNVVPANAEQRTTQAQSPAIGLNTGSITYENKTTPISIVITPSTSIKLNTLEQKQEALLVAQNPTTLEMVNVRFIHFYNELLFVVDLKNTSKLPVSDVKVDIMNPHSASGYKNLKPFVLPQSSMQREQAGLSLGIAPDGEGNWPLSLLTDLRKKVINIPDSDCIYGAVLKPLDLSEEAKFAPDEKLFSNSFTHEIGVLLRIRYKSIFKQEYTFLNWVFVQSSNRHSDFVIINKTRTKLVCLD